MNEEIDKEPNVSNEQTGTAGGGTPPKTYTQEEVERLIQSEADRRTNQALDNHKEKWRREFEENAKLSAEERLRKELEERTLELDKREAQIKLDANKSVARSKLLNAGVPDEQLDNMLGILVTSDSVVTDSRIDAYIATLTATKESLEATIKSKYSNVEPPKHGGSSGGEMTAEKLRSMSYADMMAYKEAHPDLFAKLTGLKRK